MSRFWQNLPWLMTHGSAQHRCLLFIAISAPLLLIFWLLQGYALLDDGAGVYYQHNGLLAAEAIVSVNLLVLAVTAVISWQNRLTSRAEPWTVQVVIITTLLTYTLLMFGYGLKDSPLPIVALQGLILSRALFSARVVKPALALCALLLGGSEWLVATHRLPYAPMLSAPIYYGQPLSWWWGLWGRVIFDVGVLGFAGLLIYFFHVLYQQRQQLECLVRTDALTGLFNRRTFMSQLEMESHRATRYERAYCLMICDIDHFKSINDTWGHPVGDQVLAEVGRVLRTMTRHQVDIPARYGGEEFAIIVPETKLVDARKVAEKIATQLRGHCFGEGDQSFKITLSIGIAEASDAEPELVLREADQNLYRAKRAGRDQIIGSVVPRVDLTVSYSQAAP